MYYFMRQNLFQPLNIIEVMGHTEETAKYAWTSGERFPEEVPVQILLLDSAYGKRMTDFFDTTIPLMSDKLLAALDSIGVDNIDKYPMVLLRPDTGREWHNYKAVNVVGKVNAIDLNASEYTTSAIGIHEFRRIVLDPGRIRGEVFFRLSDGPGFIVVHESVKAKLSDKGFIALMFQKVEDYHEI